MKTWIENFTESQAAYAKEIKETYPGRKARVSFVRQGGGVVVSVYIGDESNPSVILPIPLDSWGKTVLISDGQEISWVGMTWDDFVKTQEGAPHD